MARLRYNNSAGTLGSPALTATATTITFASAPTFATLTGSDYIPLALDPPQGTTPSPSFEIVYLTAYTAGATTGTITRGQEGTSGQAHNIGAVWAQAVTLVDIQSSPVGSIVPYAGVGDPPENNWIIADGRLINKTTYADFFARVGHAYNGGVDPGGGMVKIPDKRGRHSIGAINMGSAAGAGPNDNAHAQVTRGGSSAGEVNHVLATTEGPVHNHWNNLSQTNLDHQHVVPFSASVSASVGDPAHYHYPRGDVPYGNDDSQPFYGTFLYPSVVATGAWYRTDAVQQYLYTLHTTGSSYTGVGVTPSIGYNVGDGNSGWCRSITGSYGGSVWNHGHTIPYDLGTTPSGGGSPGSTQGHNNLAPYEGDCYIVRIA